jgi:predicted TIM-barrel fold metal-dependent hydrolase
MRANADAVAALPLTDAAKRRILYENAERLLKRSAT